MKTAKEWIFYKYPNVKEDWCKTGHDDKFMVRMMEEYANYASACKDEGRNVMSGEWLRC